MMKQATHKIQTLIYSFKGQPLQKRKPEGGPSLEATDLLVKIDATQLTTVIEYLRKDSHDAMSSEKRNYTKRKVPPAWHLPEVILPNGWQEKRVLAIAPYWRAHYGYISNHENC